MKSTWCNQCGRAKFLEYGPVQVNHEENLIFFTCPDQSQAGSNWWRSGPVAAEAIAFWKCWYLGVTTKNYSCCGMQPASTWKICHLMSCGKPSRTWKTGNPRSLTLSFELMDRVLCWFHYNSSLILSSCNKKVLNLSLILWKLKVERRCVFYRI